MKIFEKVEKKIIILHNFWQVKLLREMNWEQFDLFLCATNE